MRAERYVTSQDLPEMTRRWLLEIRQHAPSREHWRLQFENAALLVIDCQRVFCDPAGAHFLPAFPASVGPLTELIAAWRGAGRPVVFSRHGHTGPASGSVHGRFYGSVLDARAPDAELVPPALPEPGDLVLDKDTYDAFYGTCLCAWLEARRCRQILVTGVLTHLCVETTVRSGFVRGLEPFVVADACTSTTARLHREALVAMASGFAGVLTAGQAVRLCR